MALPPDEEFLSLNPQPFTAEDDSDSSPFNTLWTEFARSHPRLLPPRTPTHPQIRRVMSSESLVARARTPIIELRALEYVSEYDSNLMCPICHVPFIDPVVLDCDHTFCRECFEEYRSGGSSTDRSKCPTCRRYHLSGSRKASRLIKNMCNDIRVRCPNNGCQVILARGCIEQHVTKECPEEDLICPDSKCAKKTKRKNFVHDQCIHTTHVECDCGATIRLGRGEWIKHKDEECPHTMSQAESSDTAPASSEENTCPGAEFGCVDPVTPTDLSSHAESCPLARLAPHLKKQSALLISLTEQLKMAQTRNEVLETNFDRLTDLITNTIQPRLDNHFHQDPNPNHETASTSETEEIPRTDLNAISHLDPHLDLNVHNSHLFSSHPDTHVHNQTQVLYNDLTHRLHNTEATTESLDQRLRDLDARSSMALMNETLRIREELAHINGAMYSTRAQLQWLLNRERITGQREAMAAGGAGMGLGTRGRMPASTGSATAGGGGGWSTSGQASASGSAAASGQGQADGPRNMGSAWSNVAQGAAGGGGSGPNSTATSPIFDPARPSMRRASGGSSQERVKL